MQAVDSAATIAEAKAAFDEVNKLGYAWRDTDEMIQQAEKAAQLNDTSTTLEQAQSALSQSRLAKAQFQQQINAGPLN